MTTVLGDPLGPHDPTSLGQYTVLRRLGQGGMGTVYLGTGVGGRRVAIKVIRPEFAQVDEFRVRFRQESENARRVARFCTAEVLDVDPDGEKPYLVTEFVEGETLSQVVAENGPLTAANLERLAVGVAAALTAIHGAGIVHRDLKPGNVMLSPFGPRVIDFGIARASDAAMAMTQIRVGTPAFMAPEQVMGERLTPALDVFAWGAVVAYAGTGVLPFGADPDRLFHRIINSPPDLSGLRDHAFLAPIVERAMSKDPARRPAANELLLSLLGGTSSATVTDPRAAVTEVLVGWTPGDDDLTTTSVETPAPPVGAGVAFEPPTAMTVIPPVPAPPGVAPPATGTGTVPGPPSGQRVSSDGPRVPAAPPERGSAPPAPEWTPGGPPRRPPDGARPRMRRGRWIAAALVAVVVVVAAVLVGTQLLGGSSTPSAGSSSPTGAASPTATASPNGASTPIPKSAPLPLDTIVVDRTDGTSHVLFTTKSDGTGATQIGTASPQERPGLSPDRRTVAYWKRSDNSLWLVAADGTGARPLLVGAAAATLHSMPGDRTAWKPDGTEVAAFLQGPDGTFLYVVNPVTGTFRKLPTPQRLGDPAWSPSGDRIAYWAGASGYGGPIYTIAADGSSGPQQLTAGPDADPAWSPDGQQLAFLRVVDASRQDLYTVSANGDESSLVDLTPGAGGGRNSGPSYAPTSPHKIVFVSDRTGTPLLYLTSPSSGGADIAPMPNQTGGVAQPCWSTAPPPG